MTRFLAPLAALVCLAPAAFGQAVRPDRPDPNVLPFEVREVGIDEKLGDQVPADLLFRDHVGNLVRLGDLFDGTRPVILTLNYSRCPKICDTQLRNLAETLSDLDLTAGEDYRVVTVSIDPTDDAGVAASRRRGYVGLMGKGSWSFLTGTPGAIAKLTRAVGFRYAYDPDLKEYHHSPVAVLLTPTGRIGRYLHGLGFEEDTLRLSLVETGEGKLGSTSDYFPLICYRYDPEKGHYVARRAELLMAGAGLLFVGLFGGTLLHHWRRAGRAAAARASAEAAAAGVRRQDAPDRGPAERPAAV